MRRLAAACCCLEEQMRSSRRCDRFFLVENRYRQQKSENHRILVEYRGTTCHKRRSDVVVFRLEMPIEDVSELSEMSGVLSQIDVMQ